MAHVYFPVTLTLLATLLTGFATGTDPGFRSTITNKELDYGEEMHRCWPILDWPMLDWTVLPFKDASK